MATLTDNFDDNSLNTAVWNTGFGSGTVAEQNQRLELSASASNQIPGVITDIAYDLTAPSSVEINSVVTSNATGTDEQIELWIGLTKTTTSDPYNENNWYDVFADGSGTIGFRKRVAGGTATTIYSADIGAEADTRGIFKIDLPASGDEVRFYHKGSQVASDATYALSSRTCYAAMKAFHDGGNYSYLDDFSLTYTGTGGGLSMPVALHHLNQMRNS